MHLLPPTVSEGEMNSPEKNSRKMNRRVLGITCKKYHVWEQFKGGRDRFGTIHQKSSYAKVRERE